jgi:uncharacterized protein (DUF427 family)
MSETVATRVHAAEERARLKDGVHIESTPRRVRAYVSGVPVVDSERALLVYETRRPPVYWFPMSDVRMDLLTEREAPAGQGSAQTRWRLQLGERVIENAAWSYSRPEGDLALLEDHITFYWREMDAWFEEDEEVFVHPRDPYTRVDTVHSSRHVKVEIEGTVVAETRRPVLLYETGLPTRYYIPKQDVRMDLLEPTSTVTMCPYKGSARYWSVRIGDRTFKDIVWGYPTPIPEIPKIENLLSFYNEKLDIYVDGKLLPRPKSPFA